MKAIIKVDKSRIPNSVSIFDSVESIEISRDEIFKFGIFKEEVAPDHVNETDFEYLMSKIPAYELLFSDFIEIKPTQIINASKDDRKMKEISEVVGIALGLKLTVASLGINQNQIEKIPPPPTKEKYLDYKVTHNNHAYEIETKGTTQESVKTFVTDIANKKKNKPPVYFRYGTVAQINKPGSKNISTLHVCDDPPQEMASNFDPKSMFRHYLSPLSFILDNRYYNKLYKFQSGVTKTPVKFSTDLFFGKYVFQGEEYWGDYFDRRLIQESLLPLAKETRSLSKLFHEITVRQGKHKIFIGINSRVLQVLFSKNFKGLANINFDSVFEEHAKSIIFRDSDGILIAKSIGERNVQIEEVFTEEEVKKRIGYYDRFFSHSPVACGAPCRSRQLQGKPCEIKTYRGSCHYHR